MTLANPVHTAKDTVAQVVGAASSNRLAELIKGRADIFALTQTTEDAVLQPCETGAISHAERAALACRMAGLNAAKQLTEHYQQRLSQHEITTTLQQLAHPGTLDTSFTDARLAALVRHVDLVTQAPKNATQTDIQALQDAGVTDADIVRLSELIAFVNYQLRLIAGLRLLADRMGDQA